MSLTYQSASFPTGINNLYSTAQPQSL